MLAIVGRVHRCIPREPTEVGIPTTPPKPKPRFGDVVNVPLSEMPARGIGPKRVREPLAAQGAGPAPAKPAKPRAKKGEGVYGFRDADARRAYMRDYMKKRRAKVTA